MKVTDSGSYSQISQNDDTSPPSPPPEFGDGMAWVSGGKIFVRNPAEGAKKATLTPCKEIQIYINGLPMTSRIEVCQEDVIEVKPLSHTTQGHIKILISPDKMSAFLDIKKACISSYQLVDCPPTNNLLLVAEEKKDFVFNETYETLIDILKKNNVTYGINSIAIRSIIKNQPEGMLLVAKGLQPGVTLDDSIEPIYEKRKITDNQDLAETIDFKELYNIPSVTTGDVLVRKMPGKEGSPGITVTNTACKAKAPKVISLLSGLGVKITDNGLEAIATSNGLPHVKLANTKCIISIDPILNLPSDVNLETGNIRFNGHVSIKGSVENEMNVSASGNITIAKIVTGCQITAGGDVTIKGNIVNSDITGGGFIVICNTIKPLLYELLEAMEDLFILANLMLEKLETKKLIIFGCILMSLIEKRFPNFYNLIDRITHTFKEVDLKLLGTYGEILQKAVAKLTGINILQFHTASEYQSLLTSLTNFSYYIESLLTSHSVVNINIALNSVIKSSGNVIVSSGCFNTHIIAKGSVTVNGIVRGGIIQAQDNVFIKQIGSERGTKSIVMVAEGKRIKINQAFDGVTVQIGNCSRTIDRPMQNLLIAPDEDGFLQFFNF
ncbi:DUF342 domain-containing protein [Desulfotomaculum sp. 1211_IL3151]|uniref:DUF342 domain-containing protein n=1 Tax=Desulfotomaculum sp. 1211_IL3151 TaxID=3084055 RepID=UPI002FD9D703